ncbi:Iron hydrogenase [Phanerochaete sordida]|uniref:Cytosolic Fe-S cluster assembly factor NAR1 n=1 Tax=Phanerochaete sordida TaxID=48140 RepID=A0A9P3GCL0_9APHY|nr:Iron hydrogenase [Phanerochaete sordida]
MAFSGALTLTDLNDFITPSQACIKPVEQTNGVVPEPDGGAASTEIRVDSTGSYYEVSTSDLKATSGSAQKKLQTAEISLNDCLACSGCITSAESVLISMQSHTEVLNFLANNPEDICVSHKVPVISIAPQSLASLAASISSSSKAQPVTLQQVYRRVEEFCTKVLGFQHVYDTTFARHLSLSEHVREFKERKSGKGQLPMLASACPGWVCYAEKTHAEMLPFISRTKSPQQVMGTLVKEWLGSKWGKSPSQIYHVTVMPCYDKKLEASRQDFYNDVYATREVDCVITTGELELMMREKGWNLNTPVEGENDDRVPYGSPTDCSREDDSAKPDVDDLPGLIVHPGTSSGSYLHSLINALVHDSPAALELNVRAVRAPDYEEYILSEKATGTVVFRGAKCYGFRNLQNLVRKVGRDAGVQVGRGAAGRLAGVRGRAMRKKADGSAAQETRFDYVEVMACPGGCVNGGGQLKPPTVESSADAEGYKRDWDAAGVKLDDDDDTVGRIQPAKWGDREWTKKVEVAYWSGLPTPPPSPKLGAEHTGESASDHVDGKTAQAERLAARVLSETCRPEGSAPRSWTDSMDEAAEERRRKYFRTQYRAVESEVVGLAVKW